MDEEEEEDVVVVVVVVVVGGAKMATMLLEKRCGQTYHVYMCVSRSVVTAERCFTLKVSIKVMLVWGFVAGEPGQTSLL
jgi:hypothetical protein